MKKLILRLFIFWSAIGFAPLMTKAVQLDDSDMKSCDWNTQTTCPTGCAAASQASFCGTDNATLKKSYPSTYKCCCCEAEVYGCCTKTNQATGAKTTKTSTLAACQMESGWAKVSFEKDKIASSNSCADKPNDFDKNVTAKTAPDSNSNQTASTDNTVNTKGVTVGGSAPSPSNPLGTTDLRVIIGRVVKMMVSIVGTLTLMMLVYGGFLWLTSAGNDKKVSQGKAILMWSAIGLLIIFLAYVLVMFVFEAIGV